MTKHMIRWLARASAGALVLSTFVCSARSSSSAEVTNPDAPVVCIQYWPEARYRNYGYDHIVHLLSGCTRWASCNVSTNVNPEPISVRIGPSEHKEVLTFRGSPAQEFVPNVRCELDSE